MQLIKRNGNLNGSSYCTLRNIPLASFTFIARLPTEPIKVGISKSKYIHIGHNMRVIDVQSWIFNRWRAIESMTKSSKNNRDTQLQLRLELDTASSWNTFNILYALLLSRRLSNFIFSLYLLVVTLPTTVACFFFSRIRTSRNILYLYILPSGVWPLAGY